MSGTEARRDGLAHTEPSDEARELVKGAYDLHLHISPDVMPRKIGDLELARRFEDLGLAGFVLKSHYVSTAERASLVRTVVPGVNVLGAISLNNAVGGMNPLAVEIAGREGAKIVWLPTTDSANEARKRASGTGGAKLPFWAKLRNDLNERGMGSEPVGVVDATGAVLPETRSVLRTIAAHDMILATGHLDRDEIFAVVEAAREEGVGRIVVTHPEFPTQNLSADDQAQLAQNGALLERCFVTAYTGKVSWEDMFANIRLAGEENSFVSSDLGQPDNPNAEDGLALMAERMLAYGFSEDEIHRMTVENTKRLVSGAVAR